MAVALANAGRYEAADSAYRVAERIPGFEPYQLWLAAFPSATGDYGESRRRLEALLDRTTSDLADREFGEQMRGTLEVLQGRFEAAGPFLRSSETAALRVSPDHYLGQRVSRAANELFALRDTARALRTLEAALEEVPLDDVPATDWPAEWMAQVLAGAGRPERAEALLDTWLERVDPRLRAVSERRQHAARGAIALARDEPERALEEFRRQKPDDCRPCAALGPAVAFDAMGQADSAIAYFEEYIGRPYHWRLFPDASWRGHVLERLGELYDARGDLEQAAGWYGQFIELWKDADAPLQARVNAARERVEEIYAERS